MSRRSTWLMAAALGALAAAPPPETLTIAVGNVRNATGIVHVELCRQDAFLTDRCTYAGEAPARAGTTIVVVRNLPAGRYAAQAYHDENGNRKVDRALFGIPREGVGFSRDARITFGPPRFADAAFDFTGRPQTIAFGLRYFLGPSGPKAAR